MLIHNTDSVPAFNVIGISMCLCILLFPVGQNPLCFYFSFTQKTAWISSGFWNIWQQISICLVCVCPCLSICLSICLSKPIFQTACLSVLLYLLLSVWQIMCLTVCLLVRLSWRYDDFCLLETSEAADVSRNPFTCGYMIQYLQYPHVCLMC